MFHLPGTGGCRRMSKTCSTHAISPIRPATQTSRPALRASCGSRCVPRSRAPLLALSRSLVSPQRQSVRRCEGGSRVIAGSGGDVVVQCLAITALLLDAGDDYARCHGGADVSGGVVRRLSRALGRTASHSPNLGGRGM